MTERILLASQDLSFSDILVVIVGVLLIVGAVVLLFVQRRTGRELNFELGELAKMKKNNGEFEFIMKTMRLATWHVDPKTLEITYDNDFRENVAQLASFSNGMSAGDGSTQIYKDDQSRVARSMESLCSGDVKDYHEQYRVMTPYSPKLNWEESFAIVAERDIDGQPTRVVGTSMWIDDRKAMEEALVAARNKAEESDRLKTAFIANMSHEIRTPLNAIIGFTSLLPDVSGEDERKELINLIQENNQKLLRIIDDVINISKVEAGQEELQLVTVELNMLLNSVIDKYTPKLLGDVKMVTEYGSEVMNITTDMNRLQEIMNHLISNAVKFTFQGTIAVGYELIDNDRIKIWVRDTGKGVPDDLQERIFERFFKVDEFIPGAGLGLSVCRTMAYSLGGQVTVDSKLGEGSTFWLEIPV